VAIAVVFNLPRFATTFRAAFESFSFTRFALPAASEKLERQMRFAFAATISSTREASLSA